MGYIAIGLLELILDTLAVVLGSPSLDVLVLVIGAVCFEMLLHYIGGASSRPGRAVSLRAGRG